MSDNNERNNSMTPKRNSGRQQHHHRLSEKVSNESKSNVSAQKRNSENNQQHKRSDQNNASLILDQLGYWDDMVDPEEFYNKYSKYSAYAEPNEKRYDLPLDEFNNTINKRAIQEIGQLSSPYSSDFYKWFYKGQLDIEGVLTKFPITYDKLSSKIQYYTILNFKESIIGDAYDPSMMGVGATLQKNERVYFDFMADLYEAKATHTSVSYDGISASFALLNNGYYDYEKKNELKLKCTILSAYVYITNKRILIFGGAPVEEDHDYEKSKIIRRSSIVGVETLNDKIILRVNGYSMELQLNYESNNSEIEYKDKIIDLLFSQQFEEQPKLPEGYLISPSNIGEVYLKYSNSTGTAALEEVAKNMIDLIKKNFMKYYSKRYNWYFLIPTNDNVVPMFVSESKKGVSTGQFINECFHDLIRQYSFGVGVSVLTKAVRNTGELEKNLNLVSPNGELDPILNQAFLNFDANGNIISSITNGDNQAERNNELNDLPVGSSESNEAAVQDKNQIERISIEQQKTIKNLKKDFTKYYSEYFKWNFLIPKDSDLISYLENHSDRASKLTLEKFVQQCNFSTGVSVVYQPVENVDQFEEKLRRVSPNGTLHPIIKNSFVSFDADQDKIYLFGPTPDDSEVLENSIEQDILDEKNMKVLKKQRQNIVNSLNKLFVKYYSERYKWNFLIPTLDEAMSIFIKSASSLNDDIFDTVLYKLVREYHFETGVSIMNKTVKNPAEFEKNLEQISPNGGLFPILGASYMSFDKNQNIIHDSK